MKDEFGILARFLERYGDDVEGRALGDVTPEIKSRLRDFARGKLSAADRVEVARLLKENPAWVGILAEEAKETSRGGTAGAA